MNKKLYSLLLGLLTLTGLMSGCKSDDDIAFDHEQPMFDIQADKILLEVMLPTATAADEEVYIVGDFNGETDETVIGNDAWKLLPTDYAPWRRGIYLDPNMFKNGKTLADGFHFVSATQRNEVTGKNEPVDHYLNVGVGTRTNVYVALWAAYFDVPDSGDDEVVDHDGYALFVDDQTGWGALALYAWGDAELFGSWPGTAPTGTQRLGGINFKYFDFGEENTGLNLHLILNNNDNGKQVDDIGGGGVVIDHDIYVRLTETGWEEIEVTPTVKHDGYAVFILNESSQTDLALYAWGDSEAFGGWPGMAPTGVQVINGLEYIYFDMGEANTGSNLHLIPNNNNNGTQWEGDALAFTIDHDIYIRIWDGDKSSFEVISKDYQGGGVTPTPEPQPQPAGETVIIAVKNSVGYANPHLYVYGDGEACGGWPGAAPVKITDNGWCLFELPANGNYNLILNDNGSPQVDGPAVSTAGSHFFDVSTAWVESPNTVTIRNNTSYSNPRLYAWGDGEIYNGWRGIRPTTNENGVLVFPLPNDGGTYNLILNGEGDGVQQDISQVVANQSYSFTAN